MPKIALSSVLTVAIQVTFAGFDEQHGKNLRTGRVSTAISPPLYVGTQMIWPHWSGMLMTKRTARMCTEREMAIALVLELANTRTNRFSLLGFYDEDLDVIAAVADKLNLADDRPFRNKLRRVCRRLVSYDALYSSRVCTQKEYIGEPEQQLDYVLLPGKARLLTRGRTDVTMEPEGEAAFLLRWAYPAPDDSTNL